LAGGACWAGEKRPVGPEGRERMVGWIGEEKKKEIFLFMIFDSRN
jgi:hypothetical protein